MKKSINVCIGIQARSASKRFPNKIYEPFGRDTILGEVISSCESAVDYNNRRGGLSNIHYSLFMLIPKGDPVIESLTLVPSQIIQGDENDVLSRYVQMAETRNADYVVRVTADCPMIPDFLIYKCANTAVRNSLDYCSNIGPRLENGEEPTRTSPDGHDVEAISIRALKWANENAKGVDREHVTTALRAPSVPEHFRFGQLFGPLDLSMIKLSVDTKEDLERARSAKESNEKKMELCQKYYGKSSIHRY